MRGAGKQEKYWDSDEGGDTAWGARGASAAEHAAVTMPGGNEAVRGATMTGCMLSPLKSLHAEVGRVRRKSTEQSRDRGRVPGRRASNTNMTGLSR